MRLGADRTGISGAVARIVAGWALLGGLVLLAVIAVNMVSVVGAVFGNPFPGDFELTEMGVAIAVFAFLPYCQITDANVTADIFTARAGPRLLAALRALASLIAFLFAIILVWRMSDGMLDQRDYNYTTTILQLPIWLAYLPILLSLALLVAAALVTLTESLRATQGGHNG
jgi:TRAP-type C4-dicarboxylate transport system permease small subunit